MHLPPGFQGRVAACLASLEIAVGEVEFPVALFGVADEVADTGLEVGQRDVGVDPGQEHAAEVGPAVDVVEEVGPGDPVVGDAGTLQERLAEGEVVVGGPGRGDDHVAAARRGLLADRRVVVVVDRLVGEAETGTGRGPLGEARPPVGRVADQHPGEDGAPHTQVDVLRLVDPVPRQRTRQLGVEQCQGALDAAEGVGFDDGRVVDRRGLRRGREQGHRRFAGLRPRPAETGEPSAEVPQHLAVLERRADRLLQRQFPDLVERGIGEGQRFAGPGRLIERLLAGIGVFDLLDRPHVVRQVTVLEEVEGLPGRASRGDECQARGDGPDLLEDAGHGCGVRLRGVVVWCEHRRCASEGSTVERRLRPTWCPPTPSPLVPRPEAQRQQRWYRPPHRQTWGNRHSRHPAREAADSGSIGGPRVSAGTSPGSAGQSAHQMAGHLVAGSDGPQGRHLPHAAVFA